MICSYMTFFWRMVCVPNLSEAGIIFVPDVAFRAADHANSSGLCAGNKQPEAAAAALHALLVEKQKAHSITLQNKHKSGRISWTLFEMWQATVSVALYLTLSTDDGSLDLLA